MEASPELRIGDRERREVDDRLRAAHEAGMLTLVEYDERAQACFAARFRRELDVLVEDLAPAETPPVTKPDAAPVAEREAAPATEARVPLLDRAKAWGGNLVGLAVTGVLAFTVLGADQGAAIFGDRTVVAAPGQSEVEVGVLFGSTKVVVPEGVQATTSGLTVFGSISCSEACAPEAPGSPQVEITGGGPFGLTGAFGSVEVITPAEDARGGLPDLDDD